MNRLLPFCAAALLGTTLAAQTPKIVVQGSGTPQVFNTLSEAVSAATASDIIYLSGGDFPVNVNLNIDHEVHIVGAGSDPNASGLTSRSHLYGTGSVVFAVPASNCTVTGLQFSTSVTIGEGGDNNTGCDNMLFTRCHFENYLSWSAAASTVTLEQCYLQNGIQNVPAYLDIAVQNCVVGGSMFSISGNVVMRHCTVLCVGAAAALPYENCVFVYTFGEGGIGNASYLNCLFYNVTPFTTNQVGCVFSSTNPFASNDNLTFDWTDDLHLATGSAGIGLATDGTDAGIYGGTAPFKPAFVPYNPHYTHLEIAPATDANGNLPVNITVERQTN